MFVKLYTYSSNEKECKSIFNDIMNEIDLYVDRMENLEIEEYWKVEGMHVLYADVFFKEIISKEIFLRFLNTITDGWYINGRSCEGVAYGSENAKECTYIKKNVSLITFEYNENEVVMWEDET